MPEASRAAPGHPRRSRNRANRGSKHHPLPVELSPLALGLVQEPPGRPNVPAGSPQAEDQRRLFSVLESGDHAFSLYNDAEFVRIKTPPVTSHSAAGVLPAPDRWAGAIEGDGCALASHADEGGDRAFENANHATASCTNACAHGEFSPCSPAHVRPKGGSTMLTTASSEELSFSGMLGALFQF